MLGDIIWTVITVMFIAYVAWRKYRARQKVSKQWEGQDPNERPKSIEELRLNENKYRKADGGGFTGI